MHQESLSPIGSETVQAVAVGATLISKLSDDRFAPDYARLSSVLQPLSLLPVQYNDLVRRHATEEGESRLLLAVLRDALRSYLRNMDGQTAQARREFEEDWQWFYGEHQEGIFAFEQVCEALGIHPEPLRRWLRSLENGVGDG